MAKKNEGESSNAVSRETKTQRKRNKRKEKRLEYSKQIEKAQFKREVYVLICTALVIVAIILWYFVL